jgi:hypothetical protein
MTRAGYEAAFGKAEIMAFWGSRLESIASCASRTTSLLTCLSSLEGLSSWFGLVERPHQKSPEVPIDEAVIGRLMEQEYTKAADMEWSRFDVWNGKEGEAAARLSVSCGAASDHIYPSNGAELSFWSGISTLPADVFMTALRCIIRTFEPDWAVFGDYTALQYLIESHPRGRPRNEPRVEWMTYLRGRGGPDEAVRLPPSCRLERLEDGILVIVEPALAGADEEACLAILRELDEALRSQGLLDPY